MNNYSRLQEVSLLHVHVAQVFISAKSDFISAKSGLESEANRDPSHVLYSVHTYKVCSEHILYGRLTGVSRKHIHMHTLNTYFQIGYIYIFSCSSRLFPFGSGMACTTIPDTYHSVTDILLVRFTTRSRRARTDFTE